MIYHNSGSIGIRNSTIDRKHIENETELFDVSKQSKTYSGRNK